MASVDNEFPTKQKVFVGREGYLNKINELFETKQIVAISAFGGTGKSTLALEYCHTLVEKDPNSIKIRWLNAATSFQLQEDLENLAEKLNLEIENRKIDFIIRSIYTKLNEIQLNILLVFDNVETFDDIKDFIKAY